MIEISSIVTAVLTASFYSTVFYASKSMSGTEFDITKWLATVAVGAGIGFVSAFYGNALDQAGFLMQIAAYGGAITMVDKVITMGLKWFDARFPPQTTPPEQTTPAGV